MIETGFIMSLIFNSLFTSFMHTAASDHPADLLVHSSLPADLDPVADHHSSPDCHLGIVDEALDSPARHSKSYFVHPAGL